MSGHMFIKCSLSSMNEDNISLEAIRNKSNKKHVNRNVKFKSTVSFRFDFLSQFLIKVKRILWYVPGERLKNRNLIRNTYNKFFSSKKCGLYFKMHRKLVYSWVFL